MPDFSKLRARKPKAQVIEPEEIFAGYQNLQGSTTVPEPSRGTPRLVTGAATSATS